MDVSALSSDDIDIQDVRKTLAPDFVATFKSLYNIMTVQETKLRLKEQAQASQLVSQSISSDPSQRTTPEVSSNILSEPITPDQPTHPLNPKWSGSSTASQDEEATKKLLSSLVSDTMTILESEFQTISWQRSGLKVKLIQTFGILQGETKIQR